MNKVRLLQEFAERAAKEKLAADLVRLYLLFLAAAGPLGEGTISLASIGRALGKSFTTETLTKRVARLQQKHLIEVVAMPRGAAPLLHYRLLPIDRN